MRPSRNAPKENPRADRPDPTRHTRSIGCSPREKTRPNGQRDGELLRACSARKGATARQRSGRHGAAPCGHKGPRELGQVRHPGKHEDGSGSARRAVRQGFLVPRGDRNTPRIREIRSSSSSRCLLVTRQGYQQVGDFFRAPRGGSSGRRSEPAHHRRAGDPLTDARGARWAPLWRADSRRPACWIGAMSCRCPARAAT